MYAHPKVFLTPHSSWASRALLEAPVGIFCSQPRAVPRRRAAGARRRRRRGVLMETAVGARPATCRGRRDRVRRADPRARAARRRLRRRRAGRAPTPSGPHAVPQRVGGAAGARPTSPRCSPQVDAITVATPPATHKLVVLAALRAGRHVLCEKPFTLTTNEARDLVAAAERARLTAMVGHEFRWATERAVLGRAIADGLIGEPRFATFVQFVPLVADPAMRMPRVVVRPVARWRLARRVGVAPRRPGARLARRVRDGVGRRPAWSATGR